MEKKENNTLDPISKMAEMLIKLQSEGKLCRKEVEKCLRKNNRSKISVGTQK